MCGRPLGSPIQFQINLFFFASPSVAHVKNQTQLAHYPDKYGNLELRNSSQVISLAGLHIKLGKLLAAAL